MGKNAHFLARAARHAKQMAEPVASLPLVELTGEHRVLIENHIGVTEYGLSEICVAVKFGHIRVLGTCMHLQHMTRERLLITGNIDQISLCRRCSNR